MNKRQVTILWAIALVLAIAVTAVKIGRQQETKSSTARKAGETLFPSFPAGDVASIKIKGATDSVTLVKKDGKWTVTDRDGYPANAAMVNEYLRTVGDLKVTQGMQAGPSFASRFGMDENAKVHKEHGVTSIFKDSSGKALATFIIGKPIESNSQASPMGGGASGHFVRNLADESGFYAVSEMFASLSDLPARWLAQDFIGTEKIQSISVTKPGSQDLEWKVSRTKEDAELALEGAAAGENIEETLRSSLGSLFAYSRFDDVVPATEIGKRSLTEQKRIATITTFEGLTYTITFTPTKPGSTPPSTIPNDTAPPADEAFLVTIGLTGDLPKERTKAEGEKPEDAKTKDEAFAERNKTLAKKIEDAKALAAYTFQVGKPAFEPLLKDRVGLTKKPEVPTVPGAGGTIRMNPENMTPFRPSGIPIEATTPPVSADPEQK